MGKHSVFWHQHLRLKFSSPADFFVYDALRMRKGTFAARYGHLILVFLVSGVFHQILEVVQGLRFRESGAIQFFLTQVLGIVIEDAIQATYRSVYSLRRDESRSPPTWARWLGYIWVFVFLVWSEPVWSYPTIRANTGSYEDELLPFSLLQRALKYRNSMR